jgi:hypothetical protein
VLTIVAVIACIAWTNGSFGTAHVSLGASVLLVVLSGFGLEIAIRPSVRSKSGPSVQSTVVHAKGSSGNNRFARLV